MDLVILMLFLVVFPIGSVLKWKSCFKYYAGISGIDSKWYEEILTGGLQLPVYKVILFALPFYVIGNKNDRFSQIVYSIFMILWILLILMTRL